jgi:hypothetical protein
VIATCMTERDTHTGSCITRVCLSHGSVTRARSRAIKVRSKPRDEREGEREKQTNRPVLVRARKILPFTPCFPLVGGDIYRFPAHKNRGNRATLRIAAIAATTGTPATAVTTGIVAMAVTRSLEPR